MAAENKIHTEHKIIDNHHHVHFGNPILTILIVWALVDLAKYAMSKIGPNDQDLAA